MMQFQANVSIGRISKFLKNGDLDPENVQHNDKGGKAKKKCVYLLSHAEKNEGRLDIFFYY